MRIIKTKDRKYPLNVVLSNGTVLKVPKQSKFDNAFLRCHGCSLMAEYLGLQYIGKHVYPLHLLQWHRTHDKADIKAKVTLKGVTKGINHYKPQRAVYEVTPTLDKMEKALKVRDAVILEQKNPIHSIFIFREGGLDYMITYGKVKRISLAKIAKTATTNKTYRGMVIVKKEGVKDD